MYNRMSKPSKRLSLPHKYDLSPETLCPTTRSINSYMEKLMEESKWKGHTAEQIKGNAI